MNIITKQLCSLGGADISILDKCPPGERNKFLFSGMAILNTALLSAIMIGITIYSINKSLDPLIIFIGGLVGGMIIFSIDRGLIATIHKKEKIDVGLFLGFLLRILISVVISFMISLPMEVIIFKDFLPMAHHKQRINFVTKMNGSKPDEKDAAQKKTEEADKELTNWIREQEEIYAKDAVLLTLNQERQVLLGQYNSSSRQYEELNRKSSERITSAQRSIDAIQKELNQMSGSEIDNETQQRIQLLASQRASYNTTITAERNEMSRRANELNDLDRRIQNKQAEIAKRREDITAKNQEITRRLTERRKNVQDEYNSIAREIEEYITENESAADIFVQDNLINNLIALAYIESWKHDHKATDEEKAIAERITQVRLLIMSVLLIIDVAPILIKLLFARGVYEAEKEAVKEMDEEKIASDKIRVRNEKQADNDLAKTEKESKNSLDEARIQSAEDIEKLTIHSKNSLEKTKIQSENRLNEKKILMDTDFAEMKNYIQAEEDFFNLLTKSQEQTINKISNMDKNKQQLDVHDHTSSIMKTVLQNTQNDLHDMFNEWKNKYYKVSIEKSREHKQAPEYIPFSKIENRS
jgi:hypothetical protein